MALGNLLRLGGWIRQMISKNTFWPLQCCTFYKNSSIKILLNFLGTMQKNRFIQVNACLILETFTWNCQKICIGIAVVIRITELQCITIHVHCFWSRNLVPSDSVLRLCKDTSLLFFLISELIIIGRFIFYCLPQMEYNCESKFDFYFFRTHMHFLVLRLGF